MVQKQFYPVLFIGKYLHGNAKLAEAEVVYRVCCDLVGRAVDADRNRFLCDRAKEEQIEDRADNGQADERLLCFGRRLGESSQSV